MRYNKRRHNKYNKAESDKIKTACACIDAIEIATQTIDMAYEVIEDAIKLLDIISKGE